MLPGDWRSMRPIVDRDKCVKCAVCWLYCPVQCIVERPAWFDIDLRTCKGCGICAVECPHRAIVMVAETTGRAPRSSKKTPYPTTAKPHHIVCEGNEAAALAVAMVRPT